MIFQELGSFSYFAERFILAIDDIDTDTHGHCR